VRGPWVRWVGPLLLLVSGMAAGGCFSIDDLDQPVSHKTYVEDWRDEMIYQVLTDRFANGDTSNDYGIRPQDPARYHGGDYKGIEDHLDYLQGLGITTLWISPIVKNVDSDASIDGYHGYWTQDFTALNPHFGDMAALRSMVNAVHARGMKVVLDIVTNHVGQAFFYDINGNGVPDEAVWGGGNPNSPIEHRMEYDPDYEEPYVKARTSLGEAGPAPILFFRDALTNHMPPRCDGCPDPGLFQRPEAYHRRGRVYNWGNDRCCTLLHTGQTIPDDCHQPEDLVAGDVCNQVQFGDFPGGLKDLATESAAVRLNLQYAFRRWLKLVDFDGFRIDTLKHVEHEFWQDFCPQIRSYARDLGKDRFLMFGEAFTGFDPLIGSYTSAGEVDSAFYFSQKYVIDAVFKSGQPTLRIKELFDQRPVHYNSVPQELGAGQPATRLLVNFLDNHDVARFLYDKPSLDALHSALVFLYTEDGIPCLYYGTEQNFSGGNDPANREDLWASSYRSDGPTFQLIRTLTGLRRQYAALRRGELQFNMTDPLGAGILAFERVTGDQRVLIVLNTQDSEPKETSDENGAMKVGFAPATSLVDVLGSGGTQSVAQDGTLRLTVGPRQAMILVEP
jgi:alpha-amylase